jgi:hypothetical protein
MIFRGVRTDAHRGNESPEKYAEHAEIYVEPV